MNCLNCGFQLTSEDQFCKNCGAAVTAQLENGAQPMQQSASQNEVVASTSNQQNIGQPTINAQPFQQAMAQGVTGQQKQSDNIKFIVIGAIAIVAIIAGVFLFLTLNKTTKGQATPVETTPVTAKAYKVNFKGFTFTIPDKLVYEQNANVLAVGDEVGSWVVYLEVQQGSFAQLKTRKSQLASIMQQSGYTCAQAVEKKLGGTEFITMEISKSGEKAIAALAKLNSMNFAGITALTRDNEYDYKILEKIAPIINSAEQAQETNNMEITSNVDMSSFAELAK